LPLLRGAAIFLTLLMLAGPVLQHRQVTGNIPRVDVYIDASGSMLARDAAAGHAGSAVPGEAAGLSPVTSQPNRLQRASQLVLGGGAHRGWLESMLATHDVVLHGLVGNSSRLIWDSRSDLPLPTSLQ